MTMAGPISVERRLNFSALWSLYAFALRQHRHGNRWIMMGAMMVLPAGLAVLVRCTARNVPGLSLEFILAFMFIPQALLPLVSLVYASGMILDEQEDQTFTYLLIRPIPKWAIYLIKLTATLTAAIALTVVFTGLTYLTIYVGSGANGAEILHRCIKACLLHSLAVLAYCCLFGMMSLVTKRILLVGILYIAVFEGLFANLAFGIRLITVIYYTRLMAFRVLPFAIPTPFGAENLAADTWQLDIVSDPKLLEHPQFNSCLMILVIGSVVCALLAGGLCSRREFHVKTPEKN